MSQLLKRASFKGTDVVGDAACDDSVDATIESVIQLYYTVLEDACNDL